MSEKGSQAPPGGAPAARGRLGTGHILFLIVAAAAPLSAMVGTVPLAFAFGNGAGVPAAFLFAGVTLLCFSVGYAVSARRTGGSGGFYASTALGVGRPPAVATGYVALVSYNCATVGLAGALGYFVQLVLAEHGFDIPWEWCAGAGIALVAVLGYREIAVSARLVALLLLGEIGVLAALDIAILIRDGASSLPAQSFSYHQATGPGAGVALMFAFVSFIGFESAALYGKEARSPRRSVPRATFGAVVLIAGFYALTSWLAVGAVGTGRLRQVASQQLGDLFFGIGERYLGGPGATVLEILLCTSLFAATLALHSAANRYAQVLAADGLLPAGLGRVHRVHGSPHRASLAQTVVTVLVVGGFAVAGLDPYTSLTTTMLGLGTLGIVVLQAVAALSVLGPGLRSKAPGRWWREILVPFLGFAGLTASVCLVVGNFDMLTGATGGIVAQLPWLLVAAAVLGGGYGLWLRRARPERYAALAATHRAAPEPDTAARPAAATAPVSAPAPVPAPPALAGSGAGATTAGAGAPAEAPGGRHA